METVIIKYQHPKGTKQKENSFFLIRLIKSLLYFFFKILTFWIPRASLNYEGKLEDIDYWYIEIEAGIPQKEIGFDFLNRAVLFGPSDLNNGLWANSITTIDFNQYQRIDKDVFYDIFEAMKTHDIDCIRQKLEKYFHKWTDNNSVETPKLPLLIYDLTDFDEIFYCDSLELLANDDLIGYEWDSSKRLIDAKGKIYKTTYINFGHPIGCVYPEKIEEIITLDNFKNLLRINFNKIRDKELRAQTFEELFVLLK